MLYVALKFTHVLLAIVAVGFNASYGLLIARARKTGTSELRFALRTVKFMDDRIANPCYLLLLVTGVGMVHVQGLSWSLKWVHGGMGLLLVLAALAFGVYTPTLRRQIAALEARGPDDAEFLSLSRRGALVGALLGVITLAIVALMVFKPA
jgi:uncharacterized membrane protein